MRHSVDPVGNVHISVNNVSFSYNGHAVLENINFRVKRGEYLGIVGPNGGGKTTLVKIILGLLSPESGSVDIDDGKKARTGYVPQYISETISQFPATVQEIVETGRTAERGILRRFTADDARAVERAVRVSGIEHLVERRLSELSGGERQKVFIARALATEPSILILDEPDAGIDYTSQEAFYSFISNLHKTLGLTIILVSHDIDTIVREADLVMCINRGMVCYEHAESFVKDEYLEELRSDKVRHITRADQKTHA